MNVLVGVFSGAPGWTLPTEQITRLRARCPDHAFLEAWDHRTLQRLLPEADIAFTASITSAVARSLSRLRWVQSPRTDVRTLLGALEGQESVVITNARGLRARAIAEHVLGVTIALARCLPIAIRRQIAQHWALEELDASGRIRTLNGGRMLVVGMGSIGSTLAELAHRFGFRVCAVRRCVAKAAPPCVERVFAPDQLSEALQDSDVVVLATASTTSTRGLINAHTLSRIKTGALLVNVGRGDLIDDDALIAALNDGRIGGAALDVFQLEPLRATSPYWEHPNVLVTPHIAGTMEDYWTPLADLFIRNIYRFQNGEPLENVVDRTHGY